jgi:hypothetical protein
MSALEFIPMGTCRTEAEGQLAHERIMKLQEDFLRPICRKALVYKPIVTAAKKDDKKRFAEEDRKWTENAQEIAGFLSGANPNWPRRDVFDLLKQHLDLIKREAVALLSRKWKDAIEAYDAIVVGSSSNREAPILSPKDEHMSQKSLGVA